MKNSQPFNGMSFGSFTRMAAHCRRASFVNVSFAAFLVP